MPTDAAAQLLALPVDFDPFAGPEISRLIPLTASQAEIWLACQLGGADASRAYNESVALHLQGSLNESVLAAAVAALVARHEALRATVSADGAVLCILAEMPAEMAVQDFTAVSPGAQQQAWQAHTAAEANHVFDLTKGPLFRANLLKMNAGDWYFTFTAHHLICDGWSLGIVLQDLGRLYSKATLPPALPFSAYADDEARFRASPAYRQAEDFWRNQFRDSAPALDLPTDCARPAARTYKSQRLDYPLAPDLVAGLRATGVAANSSLVTTLLAVFEVLLAKLTGQANVVVGLPTAGQAVTGLANLVGHCVNLLPLRSRPTGELRFGNYLRQRQTELYDALEQQRFTYSSLITKLTLRREPGRLPLVAVLFNVDLGMADGVAFTGLTVALQSPPRAYENFELSLNISGAGNELTLECTYNSALFRPDYVARLLADFEALAQQVVADPTKRLADLRRTVPVLPAAYAALNATEIAFPPTPLTELIRVQAQARPQHPAVQFGATVLTYGELEAQANQMAAGLLARQVQPGDLVALALDRSPDLLVALLAVLKCGAAYVPLDPAYPSARLEFMLTDSGAKLLLAAPGWLPELAVGTPRLTLEKLAVEALALPERPSLPPPAAPAALVYVLYTSGSTGQPKGVAVTQANVLNFLHSMQRQPGIAAADRLLAVTTISFDIAGLELWLPLVSGATVVLADSYTVRDGRALLHVLEKEQITMMQATPATWQLLLAAGWEKPLPLVALCGGEALPAALARQLLPRCRELWNMYGPTETTIWSAVQRITADDESITIGRPIANTQLYVLDDDQHPLPPGRNGELFIGGAGVAQGYWQRPELTTNSFIANPFVGQSGARLYRTGDAGCLLPTGEVQVLGRRDAQIKLRGHRIEPAEIEAQLLLLPGIREAVVVLQTDLATGPRLVAHLVLTEPDTPPPAAAHWQAALRPILPAYLIPADFEVLTALPLTDNGKVNRQALQNAGALVVAGKSSFAGDSNFVAPRTNVEQMVASIWCEFLEIKAVGIYDDFFDLGGHSLVALQVMSRLEKTTGQRLPLAALFTYPTVAALALLLQLDGQSVTWDALVPIKPSGTKMPLYIVHGAGMNVLLFNALARNMDPGQPVYGLQAKGLNGVDQPLNRIEEMAAYYVAAIQAQNPSGPYALAGYSFGGIIAFEMSKQLLAQGREVKVLAMFDTFAYQLDTEAAWPRQAAEAVAGMVKNALYSLVLLVRNPRRIYAYKREQLARKLADVARKFLNNQGTEQGNFGYPVLIDEMNEQAERHYVLTPAAVAVDLFRAKIRTFYMPDFEFLGWKPFALKGVRVHEIPGEHNYIFAPPNDKEFAAILQVVLDKAAQDS